MRPCAPNQWSDCAERSATLQALKNSGVTRLVVASSATCLAPFSQNSKWERLPSGSGQAQPGQSTPPGWFICSSVRAPRINPISDQLLLSVEIIAGMPPAVLLIESISTDDFSSGGCAEDSVGFFSRSDIW